MPECLPPMTHQRLPIGCLGQGAAKWRVIEDRVVTESAGATRLGRNQSLDRSERLEHDPVAVGDGQGADKSGRALGGWNLRGRGGSTEWPATMEILDLAAARPIWTSVPQPFKRRALVAAARGDRIYVIGGFDEQSKVVRGMDVYDAARGTWSAGPALPGGPMNGFGPAAAVVDGRVVVSIDDGSLHRLRTDGAGWEPIGQASPRIAHRLVTDGDHVLILGGARAGANLDLVESLAVGR